MLFYFYFILFLQTIFQVFLERCKISSSFFFFFSGAFFALHKSKPVLLVKNHIVQVLGELGEVIIWSASNSSFKCVLNFLNITCDH